MFHHSGPVPSGGSTCRVVEERECLDQSLYLCEDHVMAHQVEEDHLKLNSESLDESGNTALIEKGIEIVNV